MEKFKPIRLYLIIAIMAIGYYAYSSYFGIGFWESNVTKDTEYNSSNRVRGAHGFYHK